ncbi:uncharacterized protein FOMMEDRAFT_142652 [Fomitiporia mediterranea MF3/22]|uniref:uncharacterized protein n=1 Tax=Fomitiporia mediterranea (strain MF3/22) TaxID=694068 RepID=UPI00044075B9|nr:uncharacterized protein FOMMEDRAFT_142652 [Fomitiporia mediterranea MF3/22]EJC99658.1 hypothetical protein FOMMEDRAFT_142652 [Fomitiporia mediterranea MF3/22]
MHLLRCSNFHILLPECVTVWLLSLDRRRFLLFPFFKFFLRYPGNYGAGSPTSAPCGGPRGCCGSCFDDGDDEDDFDRAQRKERERQQKKAGKRSQQEEEFPREEIGEIVTNQPAPADAMRTPDAAAGNPVAEPNSTSTQPRT